LSYVARACWMVSFFFTPIYMFLLVFVVLFGPKKGVFNTYLSFWNFRFYFLSHATITFLNKRTSRYNLEFHPTLAYQFTLITSRPTSYVLFVFWCFIFFFGESLLLMLFNFSTISDTIPSNFFLSFKSHSIFALSNHGNFLNSIVTFYIFFFTVCSFLFLLNLRYAFNYSYIYFTSVLDLVFLCFTLLIFTKVSLIYFLFLFFLSYLIRK
jgi:hypothetical protein